LAHSKVALTLHHQHSTTNLTINVDLLDNKYQIEQLLGQGGMGAVYRATHLGTKRTVAVPLLTLNP